MNQRDIEQVLRDAAAAQRAGDARAASRLLRDILKLAPEHPVALNSLGMISLAASDNADAEALFVRAAAADPDAPELRINIAKARRLLDDAAGERAALQSALAIDQRHFTALVRLAELHERRGEHIDAIERWTAVLALIDSTAPKAPELDALAARGRGYVSERRHALASALDVGLAEARAGSSGLERGRFEACIDVVLGRRRIYVNECAGLHYPFLPADEFFRRDQFLWLPRLETHSDAIRIELEAALAAGRGDVRPYVEMPPGMPENKWTALDNSLDWGAIHLWKHGVADREICARFPKTVAALAETPMSTVANRMPTVFFSLLKPHSHLPPHSGVTNTRAIIHLPLIVPEGCRFRVGGETRAWQVGKALAFDDTIEHEAWNDSDQLRAVLIFDVWNPHLTSLEQDMLRDFFAIADGANHQLARSDA